MNSKLLKKLILNVCETLGDRLGNDGCNDICDDEPLLTGLTAAEKKELNKFYAENFPEEVKDYESKEMLFNTQILECVIKFLKKEKI